MENHSSGQITPKQLEALSTFVDQADLHLLGRGMRNLLLYYLKQDEDREIWLGPFLLELSTLFDFIDELDQAGEQVG